MNDVRDPSAPDGRCHPADPEGGGVVTLAVDPQRAGAAAVPAETAASSRVRSALLVVAAVLALIMVLSVVDHGAPPIASEADRRAVADATQTVDYAALARAWSATIGGDTGGGVSAISRGVPRRLLAAQAEGGAIVLTFAGRHGGCVDLVGRPEATVTTRRRCGG